VVLVQTYGRGSSFHVSIQFRMPLLNVWTARCSPRRRSVVVSSERQGSARLIQSA